MEIVNEKNADFRAEAGLTAGERSSELTLTDIFLAELGRLKRIIAGMGLSASDGEDVLQDVSIQALKQAGVFEGRQAGVRWLVKVTVNRCLMEHRRRRTFRSRAPEILKRRLEARAAAKDTDEKAIVAEELEIVRDSLRELDDSLLAPTVLRYFCDLDSKAAGEVLGLKASTVRGRLRKARMILAKRLLERGVEP
jgi:RNA polymerase sigma-70 factor (ECF subfamily)